MFDISIEILVATMHAYITLHSDFVQRSLGNASEEA